MKKKELKLYVIILKKMDKQEIFDKVCDHLMTQMEKSKLAPDLCAYRGKDGLSCAVGCLIPDEVYSEEIEECSVNDPIFEPTLKAIGVEKDVKLLHSLQVIHDSYIPTMWRKLLKNLAEDKNLTQPKSIQ